MHCPVRNFEKVSNETILAVLAARTTIRAPHLIDAGRQEAIIVPHSSKKAGSANRPTLNRRSAVFAPLTAFVDGTPPKVTCRRSLNKRRLAFDDSHVSAGRDSVQRLSDSTLPDDAQLVGVVCSSQTKVHRTG